MACNIARAVFGGTKKRLHLIDGAVLVYLFPGLFSQMFGAGCDRGVVADFGGAEVLDGTGIHIAGFNSPLVAFGGEFEEWCAVQANESFLNYGLELVVAAFHVHHHGDGDASGLPLHHGFGEVAHGRHISGDAGIDQASSVEAERVAVIGIEVGGVGATAFVAEEVVECGEFAVVFAFFFHLGKAFADHFGEKFFRFDERYLYVAVGVAVQGELAGYAFGK